MKVFEGIPTEELLGSNGARLTVRNITEEDARAMVARHGGEFQNSTAKGTERARDVLQMTSAPGGVDVEERFLVYKIVTWNYLRWWLVSYDSDADGEIPLSDDDPAFED